MGYVRNVKLENNRKIKGMGRMEMWNKIGKVRKIGNVSDDNGKKRGNIIRGDKCKNSQGYAIH